MTRIEEIRNELRGEIDRVEHIMDGSGIQPWVNYSTGALTELLSHIDHLTAQLAAKDAEVKRLRAILESLRDAACTTRAYMADQNTNAKWVDAAISEAHTALAATARGEGE